MRNTEMAKLGALVGEWSMTMSDAWFLEPPGTTVPGTTTIEWFGESLLVVRSVFGGGRHVYSEMSLVLGRSDPNDQFVALYQDDRGVCRHYAMTFDGGHWTMTREDPDSTSVSSPTSRRTASSAVGRLPRTRARPGGRTTTLPSSAPETMGGTRLLSPAQRRCICRQSRRRHDKEPPTE